jgi:hypothetical protein
MPEPVWIDRMALLDFPRGSTGVPMAEACAHAPHDCLTRMLNGRWAGHILLAVAWRPLWTVSGGGLILEAPGVATPDARWLREAAWVGANQDKQGRFGVSVGLLVWPDGPVRMPGACRVWQPGGPSQDVVAVARLRAARNRLQGQPPVGRLASWDPSKPRRTRRRA